MGSAGIQLAKLSSPSMRWMDPSWHLEVVPDPNFAPDGAQALFGRTLAGTGQHCANGAAVWRSAIRWTGRCWSQCDLENSALKHRCFFSSAYVKPTVFKEGKVLLHVCLPSALLICCPHSSHFYMEIPQMFHLEGDGKLLNRLLIGSRHWELFERLVNLANIARYAFFCSTGTEFVGKSIVQ